VSLILSGAVLGFMLGYIVRELLSTRLGGS